MQTPGVVASVGACSSCRPDCCSSSSRQIKTSLLPQFLDVVRLAAAANTAPVSALLVCCWHLLPWTDGREG